MALHRLAAKPGEVIWEMSEKLILLRDVHFRPERDRFSFVDDAI